jgi:hypothetical protein
MPVKNLNSYWIGLSLAKVVTYNLPIGQWVAPFLLFGIYNKLVKQEGHDKQNPIG